MGGRASKSASHCDSKSGGVASPASGATAGPQLPRNSRTSVSWAALRSGVGSGIQRLIWNLPLLAARTSLAQATISGLAIRSAPQAPRPPALATAMDRAGALAPAMGAKRIGTRRPNRSQNALVRLRMLMARSYGCCHYRWAPESTLSSFYITENVGFSAGILSPHLATSGRQRASRHSQFATAIRVSLNNPRNSGTLASDVAARLLRVKFTRHASSGEQAPCEERPPLRTRRRGRASQSTEVKRRGPRIIQYWTRPMIKIFLSR